MIEAKKEADIWTSRRPGDYVVVTTNGTLRKDGCLVMGRGIALEAAKRHKLLQARMGNLIRQNGLRVEVLEVYKLIAFPVKYRFFEKADIKLIHKSTLELLELAKDLEGRILMPRPGCGNGKLDWLEVEPMLKHYLADDRFVVFNKSFQGDLKQR